MFRFRTPPCAVLAALVFHAAVSPAARAEPAVVFSVMVDCVDRPASEMDSAVVTPLTRALGQAPGLARLESTAVEGRCTVEAEFDPKTDPLTAGQNFRAAVNAAVSLLPREGAPVLRLTRGAPDRLAPIWAVLTSATETPWALSETARRGVAEKLSHVAGVDEVRLFGQTTMRITVDVDPQRMAALGVTAADVARAVNEAPAPADGNAGDPKSAGVSDDAVVKVVNGSPVRLRDVSHVSRPTHAQGFALCDEAPGVLVACTLGPDVGGAGDAVRKELSRLQPSLPPATHLRVPIDLTRDRALLIEVRPPSGTRPEMYRQTADRLGEIVRAAAPHSTRLILWPGGTEPIRVLVHGDDLDVASPAWAKLDTNLPGLSVRTSEVGGAAGLRPFPVRIALIGLDPQILRQWADAAKARLDSEGAARGVVAFPGPGVPSTKFVIDRDRASQLGVNIADVDALILRHSNAASGTSGEHPADLLTTLSVQAAQGGAVPLSALVKVVQATEPEAVFRCGQFPAIRLTASPPPGVTPADAAARCLALIAAERGRLKVPSEYEAVILTKGN